MLSCLWRLLFGMLGVRCIVRPVEPADDAEVQRWRERRRRFRSKVRSALAELLTEDDASA